MPFLIEVYISNSCPVHVCTWLTMTLCSSPCILWSSILKLDDCCLTSLKRTVCNDKELVVPSSTITNFFFSGVAITVGSEPVTLPSMYDNLCWVRIDFNRIDILTLDHLEGHRTIFGINIDFPYAFTREVNLSVSCSSVVDPYVRIIFNSAIRLQCIALEGSVITASGRNHYLIYISILCANSSYETPILILCKLNGIIEVIAQTGYCITAGNEVTLVQLHILPRQIIEIEVNSVFHFWVQIEGNRPTAIHIITHSHSTIKLLPIFSEVNVTNSMPDKIITRCLLVNLSIGLNIL